MAAKKSRRQVIYSPDALQSLGEIWLWNSSRYGDSHADSYRDFLTTEIAKLQQSQTVGFRIPGRDDIRYLLLRRKAGGHGHIAVIRVEDDTITILRIYHTSQDWQTFLD